MRTMGEHVLIPSNDFLYPGDRKYSAISLRYSGQVRDLGVERGRNGAITPAITAVTRRAVGLVDVGALQ